MDLFTYLMAKKGHNTHRDLFSYLLGKNAGGSGTYTTFSGTSLNISNTLQAKIKNIALEGNTSQDGTPTPDTPIPIKVVSGNNSIKVEGKNLFDKNSGIDYGKFYTNTGEIGTDNDLFLQTIYISVNSNTQYTISGYYTDFFRICEYDKNKNFIQRDLGNDTTTSFSIITTAQTKYVRISCFIRNLSSLQLEQSSTATTYEPYKGQTYEVNLGSIELCKIGDYQDRIYKDSGKWYIEKKIGKVVLDGTNNVFASKSGQLGNSYVFNASNFIAGPESNIVPSVLSNKFIPKSWNDKNNYLDSAIMFIYSTETFLVFRFGTSSSLTTLALANAWLVNNNVTLYGILATPTTTEITDTTLISQLENINNNACSYKDTTIIECTSASTDNEVIGFSGDIKVTSAVNSLNTSLLSSNLQEETNINDIQEEPNLDDVNEIEEQNDEPIEGKIEELIENEVS